MLFCAAPVHVHCAINEEETADNVHNSHFIVCDQKACLHLSTCNDSKDGLSSTVEFLKIVFNFYPLVKKPEIAFSRDGTRTGKSMCCKQAIIFLPHQD